MRSVSFPHDINIILTFILKNKEAENNKNLHIRNAGTRWELKCSQCSRWVTEKELPEPKTDINPSLPVFSAALLDAFICSGLCQWPVLMFHFYFCMFNYSRWKRIKIFFFPPQSFKFVCERTFSARTANSVLLSKWGGGILQSLLKHESTHESTVRGLEMCLVSLSKGARSRLLKLEILVFKNETHILIWPHV